VRRWAGILGAGPADRGRFLGAMGCVLDCCFEDIGPARKTKNQRESENVYFDLLIIDSLVCWIFDEFLKCDIDVYK
jgi:hypothetical protein